MNQQTTTQHYTIHPYAAALPRMSTDEFEALKASIQRNGQQQHILAAKTQIIDGRHRFEACQELGIEPKILPWHGNDEEALAHVMAMNINRRALSVGQRAILAARAAPLKKGENKSSYPKNSSGREVLTQDEASKLFGVSPDSIQRAHYVLTHGDQVLIAQVESGNTSVNTAKELIISEKVGQQLTKSQRKALAVAADIKADLGDKIRKQRVQTVKTLNAKNQPLKGVGKQYALILADPAWNYGKSESGSRLRIENKYPTMKLDEICELPVNEMAAPNAQLFLWCPSPLLQDGLEVMRAWGFEYVSSAVWSKKGGKLSHMGGVFRVHHEMLLIGRCGTGLPKPKTGNMVSSVIEAPVTEHSAKPPVVHEILEKLYPEFANSRIELFARKKRKCWDAWGNQANEGAEGDQPK